MMNATDLKQPNRRIILGVTMLMVLAVSAGPAHPQRSGEREFAGTINNTLAVRFTLSQSGKVLSGSYVYERIGKSLRLNGAMTDEEEFYLNELDDRGKQTGKFEGAFVTKDWIEGTWSSTITKKNLPFRAWAIDGKLVPAANAHDPLNGEYRRVNPRGRFDRDSSYLDVWLLRDGQLRVAGYSSWVGSTRTGNVNVGQGDGIFKLQGTKVYFQYGDGNDDCRFTITFGVDSLTVTEDNGKCGGINVSFDGKYRKVGPAKYISKP